MNEEQYKQLISEYDLKHLYKELRFQERQRDERNQLINWTIDVIFKKQFGEDIEDYKE